MSNSLTEIPQPANPGLTVEHILLTITVVSTKESCGQFDDSCCSILRRELSKYHGVKEVAAEVLYQHTKIEVHQEGCQCSICESANNFPARNNNGESQP